MRKYINKQIIDLIESIQEIHAHIAMDNNIESKIPYLELCQQSAVMIGNILEQEKIDYSNVVLILEEYCEELFKLSQKNNIENPEIVKANNLINIVKQKIFEIQIVYHVVFFPYQASMWDSLESIYIAMSKNDNFDCYVVPIPYFTQNASTKQWVEYYDGHKFPINIKIIDYKNYLLEKFKPDFAFTHNPYDEFNMVTRVKEEYFSYNLKKYVEKLIYVPYYVTTSNIVENHKNLSVYNNMDYMVIQSNVAKENLKDLSYYDKLLPFGSPKLDRVINTCKTGGVVPQLWGNRIKGKKCLMLNTSIAALLYWNEVLIFKLKAFFEYISNRSDIAVIWRPHPLIDSTIDSMRPHLKPMYRALVQYFVQNDIGILDKTPDITNTIALSDGYIGDDGSSVQNLFAVANKPIFCFNYALTDVLRKEIERKISILQLLEVDNKYYVTSDSCGGIFIIDKNLTSISYEGMASFAEHGESMSSLMTLLDDELYFSPLVGTVFTKYNIINGRFENISEKQNKEIGAYRVINHKHKIIYLPHFSNIIYIYDTIADRWTKHSDCIEKLLSTGNKTHFDADVSYCEVVENKLWICATYTNCLIEFDMDTETYKIHKAGNSRGYSSFVSDGDCFWLTETGRNIIKWNKSSNIIETITPPKEFITHNNMQYREHGLGQVFVVGDWIVTMPAFSNSMLKINKNTSETTVILPEIFNNNLSDDNKLLSFIYPTCKFGVKLDEQYILAQDSKTGKLYKINIDKETYIEIDLKLNDQDYKQLLSDINGETMGFHKRSETQTFCKHEDCFQGIEDFISNFADGKLEYLKEAQMSEISDIAANLDGSCGEKVAEFLLSELSKAEQPK